MVPQNNSVSSRIRLQVRIAWSQLLLLTLFSSAGHSEIGSEEHKFSASGVNSERLSGDVKHESCNESSISCTILRIVLVTIRRAQLQGDCSVDAVYTQPIALLCRHLLTASVTLCINIPKPLLCNSIPWYLTHISQEIQHAVLAAMSLDSIDSGGMCLALPFPEVLSLLDEADIKFNSKKRLQSVTQLLCEAWCPNQCSSPSSQTDCQSRPSLVDTLHILDNQNPVTSILNENATVPTPLLPKDHALVQLAILMLTKTNTLVRYQLVTIMR